MSNYIIRLIFDSITKEKQKGKQKKRGMKRIFKYTEQMKKKNDGHKLCILRGSRSFSLSLSSEGKVVSDNLQWHAFSLRDFHVNEDP